MMKTSERKDVQKAEVTIPCRLGVHARCAARIVGFVRRFKSEIRVRKGNQVVDAKSILGVMSLGAAWNSRIEFEVSGEDADSAIEAIRVFFKEADYCVDH